MATLDEPDYLLQNFTSIESYADGASSAVCRAIAILRSIPVALKFTSPHPRPPHDSRREADILDELAGERNIVELLDNFYTHANGPEEFVIAFPFYPHELGHAVAAGLIPHSSSLLRRHLRDINSAIAFMHSKSIIHRDIKPSNILLSSTHPTSGVARLIDFGCSFSPAFPGPDDIESPTRLLTDVCTGLYRPPELMFGYTSYGTELDLWSWGCTIATLLSPTHTPLFNPEIEDSDLALLSTHFRTLGTPTTQTWPEAACFPHFSHFTFREFEGIGVGAAMGGGVCAEGVDLVARMVRFSQRERMTAQEAMGHAFFGVGLGTPPASTLD
ncbi:mitogen-activated protein kinase [Saitoella coloradoensis]